MGVPACGSPSARGQFALFQGVDKPGGRRGTQADVRRRPHRGGDCGFVETDSARNPGTLTPSAGVEALKRRYRGRFWRSGDASGPFDEVSGGLSERGRSRTVRRPSFSSSARAVSPCAGSTRGPGPHGRAEASWPKSHTVNVGRSVPPVERRRVPPGGQGRVGARPPRRPRLCGSTRSLLHFKGLQLLEEPSSIAGVSGITGSAGVHQIHPGAKHGRVERVGHRKSSIGKDEGPERQFEHRCPGRRNLRDPGRPTPTVHPIPLLQLS